MKKIILTALFILTIAVAGVLILASQQPSEYEVVQTISISKPHTEIYPHIANLKKWQTWSPWLERDPSMKVTYNEIDSEVGASVTWDSSSEGKGKQTITNVSEQKNIDIELQFIEPFEGTSQVSFKLAPTESADNTTVEWRMNSTNKNLMEKVFFVLMDIPTLIKKDFAKGLENLKSHVESSVTEM